MNTDQPTPREEKPYPFNINDKVRVVDASLGALEGTIEVLSENGYALVSLNKGERRWLLWSNLEHFAIANWTKFRGLKPATQPINQICNQPEGAKDEWRVGNSYGMDGTINCQWQTQIYVGGETIAQVFGNTRDESLSRAKQIVEAVNNFKR